MNISFKGDYALKVILDLAVHYNKGTVQIKEVSARQDIPKKYLEQLITLLKSSGYIATYRGPKGGIALAKPPSAITLGDIIRLVEGPTSPITCVSKSAYARCSFESRCAFKNIWEEVRNRINEVVDTVTFQDIAEKQHALASAAVPDYSI